MSRFCGNRDSSGTLRAAAHWKLRALESDGSVFSDQSLWTSENIEHLNQHFVENLDEGEGTFVEKLEHQLANSPPATSQLAAEMLWVMRLCSGQ